MRAKYSLILFPAVIHISTEDIVGVTVSQFLPVMVVHAYPVEKNVRKQNDVQFSFVARDRCELFAAAVRSRAAGVPLGSTILV